ncbi:hypothetical protein J5N97_028182 [Dioscorea zingiberensis]|uniref:RRM domain-containing protein n=1 Tax=Dioscorea zingiberensis TaxID=325984 RepID=A0A9D5H4G6_9LILI|nr:hypothetical protein J5N97_028182 [Dioscorea zingiberensis]
MDPISKKRKPEDNGLSSNLTPDEARRLIDSFSHDQLIDIVSSAVSSGVGPVLDAVRPIADVDPAHRKLFVRGLGLETTSDTLRALFSNYGQVEEAAVICDRATGRSKGYAFVTFRHADAALVALRQPSKQIGGRMTVTQLASAASAAPAPAEDVAARKIYVGGVPAEMPAERLLAHFSSYGQVEEGPLGFDKQTGKFRGFALFVYKTMEGAQAALLEPNKNIDGHPLLCKLANDGKKGRPGGIPNGPQGQHVGAGGDGPGIGLPPGSLSSQFGGPGGGLSSYQPLNSSLQSAMGGPGLSSIEGMAGSYRGGIGGPYGSSGQYGGPGFGGVGYEGLGMGASQYRLGPGVSGLPSGGHPEGGKTESPDRRLSEHATILLGTNHNVLNDD